MYDLQDLMLFRSVLRHGGLSGCARERQLPKSTLSRRLKHLEQLVGQPLLRRESNRMIPTEAGRLFDGYCQRILELAREGQEAVDELTEEISGELVVHFHEALTRGWLFRQVTDFANRYPRVRLQLRTRLSAPDPSRDDVLCLWLGELPEGGLRQERLGLLARGLYAHPDYLARHGTPTHPEELSRHRWVDVLGQEDEGLELCHPELGRWPVELPPSRLRVDQTVLQGDAITAGQGLGIFPHWLAGLRARNHPGTLAPCLPSWEAPPLPVTLLYPHGTLPRRASAFIDHIRSVAPTEWREATL